jgi:hypothetical protein
MFENREKNAQTDPRQEESDSICREQFLAQNEEIA